MGSSRAIYQECGSVWRSDFLPFGTRWEVDEARRTRYQFTGYEDQELLYGKYMDAGARFYNGIRFNTHDPLSIKAPEISPYAYCANNPVNRIDPRGMEWYSYFEWEEDEEGNIHGRRRWLPIVFGILFLLFTIYNSARWEKIYDKYLYESDGSKILGNFIVLLYSVLTVWVMVLSFRYALNR